MLLLVACQADKGFGGERDSAASRDTATTPRDTATRDTATRDTATHDTATRDTATLGDSAEPGVGLVAWWRGDGDATDSAGQNHGSAQGDVAYGDGVVGSAFELDGSSWIEVPDAPALELGAGPFTLAAWVRVGPDLRGGNEHILAKGNLWSGSDCWVLWVNGGNDGPAPTGAAQLQWADSRHVGAPFGATSIADGKWHHLAVTQSGDCTDCASVWTDGVLDGTGDGDTLSDGSEETLLGADLSGGTIYPMIGGLDEVRIYDVVLTEAEIVALVETAE